MNAPVTPTTRWVRRDRNPIMMTAAATSGTRTGAITAIRSRGLMVALELVDDEKATRTASVFRELLERGFIVVQRPGVNVLRMDPPLTIAHDDLEAFLECFERVVSVEPR